MAGQGPSMKNEVSEKNNSNKRLRRIGIYGGVGFGVVLAGVITGIVLAKVVRPDQTQYLVDEVTVDMKSVIASYNKAKASGNYLSLKPDEAVNAAYYLFEQLENTYTVGIGGSVADLGHVKIRIESRTIKEGDRFFEESNSLGLVNLYDRMFQEGETTDTYWGDNPNYASHEKKTYSNAEYKEMMGRNVSNGLIYIVAPGTLLEGDPLSGEGPTSFTKNEGGGYKVEIELDPKKGVLNYQKQMQTISSLKYPPPFEYCHLTFYLDDELLPKRFVTHERYTATTGAGFGSPATQSLVTEYHLGTPDYGFPSPDSTLPAYPETL